MSLPNCPKCQSEYTYQDGDLLICPECANEWKEGEVSQADAEQLIKDAHGTVLTDGDSVTVIKDLKVKGSSSVIKVGTKVKTIRLVPDASDGHNIDCKIDGFGQMKLKSEFVKKRNHDKREKPPFLIFRFDVGTRNLEWRFLIIIGLAHMQ